MIEVSSTAVNKTSCAAQHPPGQYEMTVTEINNIFMNAQCKFRDAWRVD
jgi:hypothetical protein